MKQTIGPVHHTFNNHRDGITVSLAELTVGNWWLEVNYRPGGTQKLGSGAKPTPTRMTIYSQNALPITSHLTFMSLDYELSSSSTPSQNMVSVSFPNKLKGLGQATDNTYLHVAADIKLSGGRQPAQIFLSIQTEEKSKHLTWINQMATFDGQHFVATLDFNAMRDLINGKYELSLTALDPSANFNHAKDHTWNLGTFDVWYREGMSVAEFNAKAESTKYYVKELIIAQFPQKANENKNPLFAALGAAAIAYVFYMYVSRQFVCQINLKRLDFWGSLLVVADPA